MVPSLHSAARVSALTAAYFLLASILTTSLRADLDPFRVPLSIYLTGPYSAWLQAAYFLHAVGLCFFAWSAFRTTKPSLLSVVTATLFAVAGVALIPVALTQLVNHASEWLPTAQRVHKACAYALLLGLTIAVPLQTFIWRHSGSVSHSLQSRSLRLLLAISVVSAAAMNLLHAPLPGGLLQKLLIGLILLWTTVAASQIARSHPAASSQGMANPLAT